MALMSNKNGFISMKKTGKAVLADFLKELPATIEEIKSFLNKERLKDEIVCYEYINNDIPYYVSGEASTLMKSILNGESGPVEYLLDNKIDLTEKEISLLYIPLTEKIEVSLYEKLLNYFKNNPYIKNKDLLMNLILTKKNYMGRHFYEECSENLFNHLFKENYTELSGREKMALFTEISKLNSGEFGIFIYPYLSNEDQTLLIKMFRYKNIEEYLEVVLNGINKSNEGYGSSMANKVETIMSDIINKDPSKLETFINMVKAQNYGDDKILKVLQINLEKIELSKIMLNGDKPSVLKRL